jgi:hypothetical protein
MIAVVTSTIKPPTAYQKSFYSFAERLEQTKTTLKRLEECGFTSIFLIDNSPLLNQTELQQLLHDFPNVQLYHLQQYHFDNKGINELLMLLYLTQHLPLNQPVFKLSGRYYPTASFKKPEFCDFAVKEYQYKKRNGTISTRGYWVKNTIILQTFLLNCLNEIFVYPERITGFRSLLVKLEKKIFNKEITPLNISLEFAAANVLKRSSYSINFLPTIGVEGLIAGATQMERITE